MEHQFFKYVDGYIILARLNDTALTRVKILDMLCHTEYAAYKNEAGEWEHSSNDALMGSIVERILAAANEPMTEEKLNELTEIPLATHGKMATVQCYVTEDGQDTTITYEMRSNRRVYFIDDELNVRSLVSREFGNVIFNGDTIVDHPYDVTLALSLIMQPSEEFNSTDYVCDRINMLNSITPSLMQSVLEAQE